MKKKIIFCLICLAVLLIGATAVIKIMRKTPKVERLLVTGQKYLSSMNYEQSMISFEEVLKIDSKNVEAYIGVVESCVKLDRYDDAKEYYEDAIDCIRNMTNEELENQKNSIVKLYLASEDVYRDNPENIKKIVQEGSTVIDSSKLQRKVVELEEKENSKENAINSTEEETIVNTEIPVKEETTINTETPTKEEIIVNPEIVTESVIQTRPIILDSKTKACLMDIAYMYSIAKDSIPNDMLELANDKYALSKLVYWYFRGKEDRFSAIDCSEGPIMKYKFNADVIEKELFLLFGQHYNLNVLAEYMVDVTTRESASRRLAYYKDDYIVIEGLGIGSEVGPCDYKIVQRGNKNYAYILMNDLLGPAEYRFYWIYEVELQNADNVNGFIITRISQYGSEYIGDRSEYDKIQ